MRKDAMEFGDPYVRAPTHQVMKIVERVAAYNSGEMDKIARIYELDEQRSKLKILSSHCS